jgi:hypothetical protein
MPEADLDRWSGAALEGRISRADYYRLWSAVMAERGKALEAASTIKDRSPSPIPGSPAPGTPGPPPQPRSTRDTGSHGGYISVSSSPETPPGTE